MRHLILFVLSLFTGCAHAGVSPEQKATLDQLVAGFKADGAFPAVSVIVDRGGETIYINTSGHANLEQDLKVTADSVYAIGSITKSFTALATLVLVDRGEIDLDAPLSEYLPDYQGPARDTEVRHLLDHTSGIPNYMGEIPGVVDQVERADLSRKQMVSFFSSQALNFPKGERFSYTNSGYYLLGLIIESVSGKTYYEFLQENILEPLGMTRTYTGDDAEIISRRVSGYAVGMIGHTNAAPWSYLVPFSAGSLMSTVGDVVKFRRGVFHHPSFEGVRKLVVQQNRLNDGTANIYALGALLVSSPDGHRKLSHPGSIWGFSSNHSYYPDEDITIVVLANNQADTPSPVSLERKMARVLFGIEQPEIRNLTLTQEEVSEYAGDYELRPFIFGSAVYGFIASEGRLYLRFGGAAIEQSPMIPLLAQGNGKFVVAFDDEWVLDFGVSEDGPKLFSLILLDGVFYGYEIIDK